MGPLHHVDSATWRKIQCYAEWVQGTRLPESCSRMQLTTRSSDLCLNSLPYLKSSKPCPQRSMPRDMHRCSKPWRLEHVFALPAHLCPLQHLVNLLQSQDGKSSWWTAKQFLPYFRELNLDDLPPLVRVDSKVNEALSYVLCSKMCLYTKKVHSHIRAASMLRAQHLLTIQPAGKRA